MPTLNTALGIQLYHSLIEFLAANGWDRTRSRSIAGLLFKVGWAHNLDENGYQSAIEWFNEASGILSKLLYEDVKLTNPESVNNLEVSDLSNKDTLEKLEVATDRSKELKSILLEISIKIEENAGSLKEKSAIDKEKEG